MWVYCSFFTTKVQLVIDKEENAIVIKICAAVLNLNKVSL